MADEDKEHKIFDRIFSSIAFMVIGVVIGAIIGFIAGPFSSERGFVEILFPWAYIVGGVFFGVGYIFPRVPMVTFLILSGCQLSP